MTAMEWRVAQSIGPRTYLVLVLMIELVIVSSCASIFWAIHKAIDFDGRPDVELAFVVFSVMASICAPGLLNSAIFRRTTGWPSSIWRGMEKQEEEIEADRHLADALSQLRKISAFSEQTHAQLVSVIRGAALQAGERSLVQACDRSLSGHQSNI